MKQCNKCKQTLPHEDFNVDRKIDDGRSRRCRECTRAAMVSVACVVCARVRHVRVSGTPSRVCPSCAPVSAFCSKCDLVKPVDEFRRSSAAPNGRQSWCKVCSSRFNSQSTKVARARARRIANVYGLTAERFDEMAASQEGRCVICLQVEPLVIDHDHKTGAVRALLCSKCNLSLGLLDDNAERVMRAASYLIEFELKQEAANANNC